MDVIWKGEWRESEPAQRIWFVLCAGVLPVCFLFSIFDEVRFNKIVIMAAFAVFCIWLFGWKEHKSIGRLSLTDRFVVTMGIASILTTLRASDLMADFQGVAYTHIEELQRLFAAAVIACFVYHFHRKAFRAGMAVISSSGNEFRIKSFFDTLTTYLGKPEFERISLLGWADPRKVAGFRCLALVILLFVHEFAVFLQTGVRIRGRIPGYGKRKPLIDNCLLEK